VIGLVSKKTRGVLLSIRIGAAIIIMVMYVRTSSEAAGRSPDPALAITAWVARMA
jgi:hypothetical protein